MPYNDGDKESNRDRGSLGMEWWRIIRGGGGDQRSNGEKGASEQTNLRIRTPSVGTNLNGEEWWSDSPILQYSLVSGDR